MGRKPHPTVKEEILQAIREKVRSGELKKGDVLNPPRIKQITRKDPRTIEGHIPGIIDEEVNGRIKELKPEHGPWIIIDPEGDVEWLNPDGTKEKIETAKPYLVDYILPPTPCESREFRVQTGKSMLEAAIDEGPGFVLDSVAMMRARRRLDGKIPVKTFFWE